MTETSFTDRVRGCILGAAIGDTLGYQVEFDDSVWPTNRKVHGFSRGSKYSDDTQLLVATLEGLLGSLSFSPERSAPFVAEEYAKWYRSPDNDRAPGGACLRATKRLSEGHYWGFTGSAEARGCGSAMRSPAYGIWGARRVDFQCTSEMARVHSGITHSSVEAVEASAAIARGVWAAINSDLTATPHRVLDAMVAGCDCPTMFDWLQRAEYWGDTDASLDYFYNDARGWTAAEAVAGAALAFQSRPDSFADCVLLAANTPGDSDSIACMAGALSGASLGVKALPTEWLVNLENASYLEQLSLSVAYFLERHTP